MVCTRAVQADSNHFHFCFGCVELLTSSDCSSVSRSNSSGVHFSAWDADGLADARLRFFWTAAEPVLEEPDWPVLPLPSLLLLLLLLWL